MKKQQQRNINISEPLIDKIERLPARAARKTAPSLKPGVAMMESAAAGHPEAVAIRDAWRFSFPVRTVSPEEFAEMIDKAGQ